MDPLEAIGDPSLRATLQFVRAQAGAVTADELASAEGIHRNVARSRLERLEDAGVLVTEYERRTGRTGPGAGRPAKTYSVAPELVAVQFPSGRYDALISLLVDAVPAKDLREVGHAFGRQLADAARVRPAKTLRVAFERLCEALRRLGYQARVVEVGRGAAVVETATCPLRPLVRQRAEITELDCGMWTGLAVAAFAGGTRTRVSCETEACLAGGPCRVRISLS